MGLYQGAGGAVFEIDPPTSGPQKELFDEKLAKGELVLVDQPVDEKPKRARASKPEPVADEATGGTED